MHLYVTIHGEFEHHLEKYVKFSRHGVNSDVYMNKNNIYRLYMGSK